MNSPLPYRLVGFAALGGIFIQALLNGRHVPATDAFSAFMLCLLVSAWIMAVLLWAKQGTRGTLHVVALVFLVPLGFLWGWAYLLAAAGTVRRPEAALLLASETGEDTNQHPSAVSPN